MPKKYKKNFLDSVIFKINFEKIHLAGLEKLYNEELKNIFHKYEEKKSIESQLKLDIQDSGILQELKHQTSPAYRFSDKKNRKILEINEKYLFIEYKKYENSEELLSDVKNIIKIILNKFDIKTITRVGLRYINNIKIKEANPLDWSNYMTPKLIGNLEFVINNKKEIARSMGQLVVKEEWGDIYFNFGIWNNEFPGKINIKEFVLDYDCNSKLPFEATENDIVERVKTYNQYIEELFENSITNNFRQLLNK